MYTTDKCSKITGYPIYLIWKSSPSACVVTLIWMGCRRGRNRFISRHHAQYLCPQRPKMVAKDWSLAKSKIEILRYSQFFFITSKNKLCAQLKQRVAHNKFGSQINGLCVCVFGIIQPTMQIKSSQKFRQKISISARGASTTRSNRSRSLN